MKLLLITFFSLIASFLYSQDCGTYYFFQNNKTVEMTIYNKKGDATGRQVYTVSSVNTTAGETTATIDSEMFDKKDKSIAKATNVIKCNNGEIMMDMKMNIPQTGQTNTDASATVSSAFMDYPASMNAGDQLKDASMQMDVETRGMKQSIDMQVTDRKVESKETVTTTAGTWECYKITSHTKMKIKTMGIGMPMNFDTTEWFAPGFGVVKTESKSGGTAITAIR
ncbi:MAG: hypothetical protein ABI683_12620 [Ginsengibacter sp.]